MITVHIINTIIFSYNELLVKSHSIKFAINYENKEKFTGFILIKKGIGKVLKERYVTAQGGVKRSPVIMIYGPPRAESPTCKA